MKLIELIINRQRQTLIKLVEALCLVNLLDPPEGISSPALETVEELSEEEVGLILLRTLLELLTVESNWSAMGDLLPMTRPAILSLLRLFVCGFMLVDNLFMPEGSESKLFLLFGFILS